MWNDAYKQYVKDLVISNRADYPYYLAYTNTNISTSYNTEYPSFYVVFSNSPIKSTGLYSYTIPANSILYSVIGGNASSTYHSQRVNTSAFSGNLTINNYEFVYTNAEFQGSSIQPNILATNQVNESSFQGFSILLFVILLACVVVKLIRN